MVRADWPSNRSRIGRCLAPFTVGGDPSVNPADFRITTFVSGLNYPTG